MKRFLLIAISLLAAAGCSELLDVSTDRMEKTYLVVESIITDVPSQRQSVRLSLSVPYFYDGEIPPVSGAEVSVSFDGSEVSFLEDDTDKGLYLAPEDFCGTPGTTYTLSVKAEVDGESHTYGAEAFMREPGVLIDAIDYAYAGGGTLQQDSLWTLGVWGEDFPGANDYLVVTEVNGNHYPIDHYIIMPDKYFDGKSVEGFPMAVLYQVAEMRKQYGDVAKFLETGDVVSLHAYTLDRPFYEFLRALDTSGPFGTIPFVSSQPATSPTNITGGDALGFFAACPVISASVTIDDPFRTSYLEH